MAPSFVGATRWFELICMSEARHKYIRIRRALADTGASNWDDAVTRLVLSLHFPPRLREAIFKTLADHQADEADVRAYLDGIDHALSMSQGYRRRFAIADRLRRLAP